MYSSVVFAETTAKVAHVIGTARGRRGTLRFVPAPGKLAVRRELGQAGVFALALLDLVAPADPTRIATAVHCAGIEISGALRRSQGTRSHRT